LENREKEKKREFGGNRGFKGFKDGFKGLLRAKR
jgi:hypothetical protein